MAKWHDLPSELIYEALSYLDRPQILRVCFVSRFLLAILLLYRNPDLTRGRSDGLEPAFFELWLCASNHQSPSLCANGVQSAECVQ